MIAMLKKFVLEDPTPTEIAAVRVPVDQSQWEAIRSRIEVAKLSLGEKYICHAANRVRRKPEGEAA
jgi:hypothetical protein